MMVTPENSMSRLRSAGMIAAAAVVFALSATAHATDYNEGPVITGTYQDPSVSGTTGSCVGTTCTSYFETNDLSSTPAPDPVTHLGGPTNIGALTLGANTITGATLPYGPVVDAATQARQFQDNDYLTFTVPIGDLLSSINLIAQSAAVPDGTTINPGDLFFMGIASGNTVNVAPPSSAGLLGFTLISSSMIGTNVLPALGMSSPPGFSGPPFSGAQTFTGPLSAGTYTLWLLDGDNPVHYKFDLQVSQAPEPTSWAMMVGGFGFVGSAMRRRKISLRRTQAFL